MSKTTIKFRQLWNCCWNSETHVITMFDDNGHEAYHAVCKSCAAAYRRQNGEHLVREILKEEVDQFEAEPRRVGDLCYNGYWLEYYLVLDRSDSGEITVFWLGNGESPHTGGLAPRVTTHRTPWDWTRDRTAEYNLTTVPNTPGGRLAYSSYEAFLAELRDIAGQHRDNQLI
jgi:hypothetical protein